MSIVTSRSQIISKRGECFHVMSSEHAMIIKLFAKRSVYVNEFKRVESYMKYGYNLAEITTYISE